MAIGEPFYLNKPLKRKTATILTFISARSVVMQQFINQWRLRSVAFAHLIVLSAYLQLNCLILFSLVNVINILSLNAHLD